MSSWAVGSLVPVDAIRPRINATVQSSGSTTPIVLPIEIPTLILDN